LLLETREYSCPICSRNSRAQSHKLECKRTYAFGAFGAAFSIAAFMSGHLVIGGFSQIAASRMFKLISPRSKSAHAPHFAQIAILGMALLSFMFFSRPAGRPALIAASPEGTSAIVAPNKGQRGTSPRKSQYAHQRIKKAHRRSDRPRGPT
jgi:hypothetical protein